jgi:hypothetical protein
MGDQKKEKRKKGCILHDRIRLYTYVSREDIDIYARP